MPRDAHPAPTEEQPETLPRVAAPILQAGVMGQRPGTPLQSEVQPRQEFLAEHERLQEAAIDLPVYSGPPRPLSQAAIMQMPTPRQLLGEGYSPVWYTAPLPSNGEQTFREIALTMQQIDAENPVLVGDLIRSGWAMLAMPEMVAYTRSQIGMDNGEAIAMMQALIPDLPDYAQEHVEQALSDSPLVAEFFTETRHMWHSDERQLMMTLLATIPATDDFGFHRRDAVLSLAHQYLNDGDHDLSDPNQRAQFFTMFYQWTRQQQQEWVGNMGGFANFGAMMSVPHFMVARGINWIGGHLVDPDEWQWRQGLSIGQNIATSLGLEPGDGFAWTLASGAIDGFNNIYLDPLNLLAGWGIGAKMSRTIALTPKLAAIPRALRAAGALLPIFGRRFTRLPRFSRNLAARFMWSLRAHPEEWFVEQARANGVWTHMYEVLHGSGGIARLLEFYPHLRPLADTFVSQMLARCDSPEAIEQAYLLAAKGQFTQGAKGVEGMEFLARLRATSAADYQEIVRKGIEDGVVAPHLLVGEVDGFDGVEFMIGSYARGRLASGATGLTAVREADISGDLTGRAIFHVIDPEQQAREAGQGAIRFNPPSPTAYDDSAVVVLPHNWHAVAVTGEGVVQGVAAGAAARGMGKLFEWLARHPDYHAVPTATSAVESAADLHIFRGRSMVPIQDAMLSMVPEGIQRKWVNAWYMRQQGVTLQAIADHFGISRRTATRWVERTDEVMLGGPTGVFAIKPGTPLIDMDETRRIGGQNFYHYRTEDGIDVWARGDSGINRNAFGYDQMSAPTRLHMALRDLQVQTLEAQLTPSHVTRMHDIFQRVLADPEMVALLLRYADTIAPDADEIRLISRMLPGSDATIDARFLTNRGAGRLQRAKHMTASEAPSSMYQTALQKWRDREALFKRIEAGGSRTIWVKDFPTHVPQLRGKRLWRSHASNDAQGWWGGFRRRASAMFFNPRYKPVFDLFKGGEGGHSLGIFLRKCGASESFITRWVNEFINSPVAERYDVVRNAVIAVSDEINHPLFKFHLVEYVEKQGVRLYAAVGDEMGGIEELGLGYGRGAGKLDVPLPLFPSHNARFVALPDEQFFRSLRRWKQTQNYKKMPGYERGLMGWGETAIRRKSLANKYRNEIARMRKEGIVDLGGLTDEDALALAYATVWRSDKGDLGGLGKVALVSHALGKAYNVFHGVFSVSQLALRPVAWAGRVLLEEQFRGAFYDLPSFARNPVRMLSSWFDEYLTSRVVTWQAKNQKLLHDILNDMWKGLPDTATPEDVLAAARLVVPDIDRLLTDAGKDSLTTAVRAKAGVAHVITHSFLNETNADIFAHGTRGVSRRVVMRTGKSRVARARLKEMGLDMDFDWGDITEIMNKGFAMRYIEDVTSSGSLPVQLTRFGMTVDESKRYGTALGRSLHQLGNDPVVGKFGLGRRLAAIAGHGDAGPWRAEALVASTWWDDIAGNIRRVAERAVDKGKAPADILQGGPQRLAEWYLTDIVDKYTDYLFGWIWKNQGADEQIRIINALMNNEPVTVKIGNSEYLFHMRAAHEASFTSTIRQIVEEQGKVEGLGLPPTVTSHWDARFLFDDTPDTITGFVGFMARRIMAFSGDKLSQYVNRRPAYLAAFRESYRYYRDRGFAHEAAQQAAHQIAAEKVNHVFYNMDNAVPFLRAFNKVSPFFTAWWEVAQTWAYKIPSLMGWGIGVPVMIRKVDRFVRALVNMGLIEFDAEPDPNSPLRTRQMRMRLDPRSNTGNVFGDVMSKTLFHMIATPATVVQHLCNVRNILGNPFAYDEGPGKDVWYLNLGKPTDPFSHGLMAVNQAYLGLNPLGTWVASNILNRIPFAVDYDRGDSVEGETVAELAARWNTTPSAVYAINRGAFEEAFGRETARLLFAGEVSPDTVIPNVMTGLKIPDSSLIEQIIDPFFFPFGREDTMAGLFFDILPGWTQYVLRGWGLHGGSSQGIEPGDDLPESGFLSFMATPETRAGISGEILVQMQHLEAEEGLMTKTIEAWAVVGRLMDEYESTIGIEVNGTTITVAHPDQPGGRAFQLALDEAQRLEGELLSRAMKNAGGALIMRGITGFVAPAIPRMLYHEQEVAAAYHQARQLAQADPENFDMEGYMLPALSGDDEQARQDMQAFNNMLATWFQEPERGSFAKHYLSTRYPEILPFIMGKTYWGPNGEAPDTQTIDQYSDDLRAGIRKPYPPHVFLQRYARSANSFSREVAIVQRYGNDPVVAASRIVQNYQSYRDYVAPFGVFTDVMDYADDFFNQGAYLDHVERNREENATLITELERRLNMDIETLEDWSLNADEVLSMSTSERQEFVGKMRAIIVQVRQGIQSWRDAYLEEEITNPRQAALAAYFDDYVGAYYDGLGALFDRLDTVHDSEERSALYDEIRNYQNGEGMKPVTIEGVAFPSVLEWWWSAKTTEEQETQLYKWVGTKPEWLNVFAAQRLADRAPEAAQYLPTTIEQAEVYNAYNHLRNMWGDAIEPNWVTGELSEYTQTQANSVSSTLQDALSLWLIQNGRGGEAVWRELLPIQRLSVLNMLPTSLRQYLPAINMVVESLSSMEKTPESTAGDQLFSLIYMQIMRDMQNNPQIGTDLVFLGERMFDEVDYDAIFPQLFQGAFIGEI